MTQIARGLAPGDAGAATEPDPRVVGVLGSAMLATLLDFGARTGLTRALGEAPGRPAEVARRAGGDSRLTREWLTALAAGGLVVQTDGRYRWADGVADSLGGPAGSPADVSAGVELFSALAASVPRVAAAFFHGGAVPADAYPDGVGEAMERLSAGWISYLLPHVWLPAVPGLSGALARGATIAEIGCGTGAGVQAVAEAWPEVTGRGFDLDRRLVEAGNTRLAAAGMADRVILECVDARRALEGPYRLVLALDVLHDVSDLDGMLEAVAAALEPDGHLLVVESPAAELVGTRRAMLLATSTLFCVPTTAARGCDDPLGTLGLTEELLAEGARRAGFATCRPLPGPSGFAVAYDLGRLPGRILPVSLAPVTVPTVPGPAVLARGLRISARLARAAPVLAARYAHDRLTGASRDRARSRLTRSIVREVEQLGATWLKFGQMLAARPDLFSPAVVRELSMIVDRVTPMSAADRGRAWREACERTPALAAIELTSDCLGSGSVACVYRATAPDGEPLAVKLQRPGVATQMQVDLALMARLARLLEHLPAAGGAPLADLVGYMGRAIFGQMDFKREAAHTQLLAANLCDLDGIVVSVVRPEWTDHGVLTTGLIRGLDHARAPVLPSRSRELASRRALGAVAQMIFQDGFVHCDLHPGNLYVRDDACVVILDAGYCVQLPPTLRRQLAAFFAHLQAGDGETCGAIMFDSAMSGGAGRRDTFIREIDDLVHRSVRPDHRFDMISFGSQVFEIQNRYRVHSPSDFAFPLMSLLIVEGTLRAYWPDLDMSQVHSTLAPPSQST